jgi:hypothetical protein
MSANGGGKRTAFVVREAGEDPRRLYEAIAWRAVARDIVAKNPPPIVLGQKRDQIDAFLDGLQEPLDRCANGQVPIHAARPSAFRFASRERRAL